MGEVTPSDAVHIFVTAILFCVSVPVLSVHITVTAPSVSTDVRVFINAFLFAILWLPIASERAIVGSMPSGMSATVMPIAKIKLSQKLLPITKPKEKKNIPTAAAIVAISLDAFTISFWSGLSPASTALVRCAIRPNSVVIPVEKTTAIPEPLITVVPAKTMLGLSINSPLNGS